MYIDCDSYSAARTSIRSSFLEAAEQTSQFELSQPPNELDHIEQLLTVSGAPLEQAPSRLGENETCATTIGLVL